jgi:polyferredoxin
MSKTIKINKEKKPHFLIRFLKFIAIFIVLGLSFYLNHKFMNGNNFFDSIIFLSFFALVYGLAFDKSYFEVSDEKVTKIEEILNK